MQLKPTQPATECPHNENSTNDRATYSQYNYQYYEEFKRLYQTAFLLSLQLKQLGTAKQDIEVKLNKVEKKNDEFKGDGKGENADRKKRFRRNAETIERKFVCQVERCHKCYGSDGSLQQHIKLKHPELYQSKELHRKEKGSSSNHHEACISSSIA